MKLRKTNTILLTCLTAAFLCIIFLGTMFATGKTASAETAGGDYALGKYEGSNFIYSANLSIENGGEQSGLVFGYVSMVEGIVARIRKEYGKDLKVIATGGLSEIVAACSKVIDVVDRSLTLKGLNIVYKLQQNV